MLVIHYGVAIFTLLLVGSDAGLEIYTDEGVLTAERFIGGGGGGGGGGGRRRYLDRESDRTKPVVDENLSRLLTEFGGGHMMRLLREFGGVTEEGGGFDRNWVFSLQGVSSLLSAFGGLGDQANHFDDVAKLFTELERRGFRRGENGRGMREDMIEAIHVMRGEKDKGRDGDSRIRAENERGITNQRGLGDGQSNTGDNTLDNLSLLLELLANESAKDVPSLINSLTKRGGKKGETNDRRRNVERETERTTLHDTMSSQRRPDDLPEEVNPQKAGNFDIGSLLQLSSLLEQFQDDGNGRGNLAATALRTGGNIIREGAALGFELGSLVALAGISTLGAVAGFAEAGLDILTNGNGLLDTRRDFKDARDSSYSVVEGRSRSNPSFEVRDIVNTEGGNRRPVVPGPKGYDFGGVPDGYSVNYETRDGRRSEFDQNERTKNDEFITDPGSEMNPRRPLSHGGTGSIPEVRHAVNTDVQMPGGSGRREDTATQNVVTKEGGSRQSYEETMSVQVTTGVNVPEGGRNGKLQIDNGSSPFIPNEQTNGNERTFTHQTPTRHQVTGDKSYHQAEGDEGNAGLEKASPVSITGHYGTPVGGGDAGDRASGDEVLGKTSEKTDDIFRDPPSEDYEFEINLREPAGDRRFDRVFGGSFLPADTIFRAAVRGESPHYVFERGSSSITSPENPSIQRGLVRHVGSFTSTQHQGKVNVRIYGAQGR